MNPVKESEITMASVEKFSAGAVRNQLRHNRREIEHSGNPDIDPSRQGQDYVLSPDRGMNEYDYFLQRKGLPSPVLTPSPRPRLNGIKRVPRPSSLVVI